MTSINKEINQENSVSKKNYPFARWMSWLFLLLSFLLLAYTFNRAEITNREAVGSMYYKYYLISVLGIIFWGVVLRLNAALRANIVTICISLLCGIYLFEGGLTLVVANEKSNSIEASNLIEGYDMRTKLEVIEDLIGNGVDAVPTAGSTYKGDLLPLGGRSNKTTVGSNETGQYMIYQSDRYGFNNPDLEWDSDHIEWLLTGDSFVLGEGLKTGENFADQIRLFTQETVINLGAGGNSPLMELASLTEYATEVKPKKVIWFYYEGNDLIHDLPRDKSNQLLIKYMQNDFSQNLINRQKEIDRKIELVQSKAMAKSKTQSSAMKKADVNKYNWLKLYLIRNMIGFDSYNEIDPLFINILTQAKTKVKSWGGEIYFIYLPEYDRYKVKRFLHGRFRKKDEVIDLVKSLNIPVIDIHQEVFNRHSDPLSMFPFRSIGHYTAEGYKKVTKVIVNDIEEFEKNKK